MAAVRCSVLASNLRIFCRHSPKRPPIVVSKTCDIGPSFHSQRVSSIYTGSQSIGRAQRQLLPEQGYSLSQGNIFISKTIDSHSLGSRFNRNNSVRRCSQKTDGKETAEPGGTEEKNLTVFQRFKKTYKEHGKILIGVHLVTSTVWFGSFYMAAVSGVDLVPWMEQMGFSELIIKPFRAGGLGYIALAYLMYKLATPARYTVTLGGTNLVIRYLRRKGRMDPIPEGHSIRNLYKDGKSEFRDRQLVFQQRRRAIKVRKERVARSKQS